MYFPFENGDIPASYASLPEGGPLVNQNWRFFFLKNEFHRGLKKSCATTHDESFFGLYEL